MKTKRYTVKAARYTIERRGAMFALIEVTTGNVAKLGSFGECDAYKQRMGLHYAETIGEEATLCA